MRTLIAFVSAAIFASPGAAAAEAVIVQLPGATLNGDSARWGEWIADVERPSAPAKVNKIDGFTIKQKVADTIPTATAPGVVQREDKVDVIPFNYKVETPRDVASGQASGKRSHEPLVPANGSVTVQLTSKWAECAPGDRFNGAYLVVGSTHRYRLDGLQVARCSSNQVAFVYAKVQPE